MPYKDPEKRREVNCAASCRWRAKNLEASRERSRERSRRYLATPEGREANREKTRKWKRHNPEGTRISDLKRLYGIPSFIGKWLVEHMLNGECQGCGVPFGPAKSMTRACVDHDHVTGLVRMLICNLCNSRSLRNCNDGRSPDTLLLAAGKNAQCGRKKHTVIAIRQVHLAALLLEHYNRSPYAAHVASALSIP